MISNTIRKLIEVSAEQMSISPAEIEDHFNFALDSHYISVVDGGAKHQQCREMLIEFLKRKDAWKKMDDLISEYEGDKFKQLDNKQLIEVIPRFLHKDPTYFYFAVNERIYLDLQDPFDITRTKFIDRDFFTFFFAFRLSNRELESVVPFLAYHYNLSFERNAEELKFFIESVLIPKHKELIGEARVNILLQLLVEETSSLQSKGGAMITTSSYSVSKDVSESSAFTLTEIIRDQRLLQYLLTELAKPEHGMLFDSYGNFIAKRKKGIKGLLVSLIEILKNKEFFKPGIDWSNDTVSRLIKNSFDGLEVSATSSTLRDTNDKAFELFGFIPRAETILKQ